MAVLSPTCNDAFLLPFVAPGNNKKYIFLSNNNKNNKTTATFTTKPSGLNCDDNIDIQSRLMMSLHPFYLPPVRVCVCVLRARARVLCCRKLAEASRQQHRQCPSPLPAGPTLNIETAPSVHFQMFVCPQPEMDSYTSNWVSSALFTSSSSSSSSYFCPPRASREKRRERERE